MARLTIGVAQCCRALKGGHQDAAADHEEVVNLGNVHLAHCVLVCVHDAHSREYSQHHGLAHDGKGAAAGRQAAAQVEREMQVVARVSSYTNHWMRQMEG